MNIGLIGCGYWGKNLLRTLINNRNVSNILVADINEDNLAEMKSIYPIISVYNDYKAIIKKVDAVIIATPPNTHYKIAKEFLLSGKDVFIEKPITQSSDNLLELIELSKLTSFKEKLILMTGHTFCYHSIIQEMKKRIDAKELGDILYMNFDQLNLGKYQKCGVVWDLLPHGLSIVDYLLEGLTPINIKKTFVSLRSKTVSDLASIIIKYPVNTIVNINISWLHPKKVRKLVVVGSKKSMIFDDINEPKFQIIDQAVNVQNESWGEFLVNYTKGDILIPAIKITEPLKNEINDFISCIINNTQPIANKYQAMRVIKIIEEIFKK